MLQTVCVQRHTCFQALDVVRDHFIHFSAIFSLKAFHHCQNLKVSLRFFYRSLKSSSECRRKIRNVHCCDGWLHHHVARKAATLPFSVTSTFTTNRLKPPLDIQLFTSDKPPSSASVAVGAIVTSTRVHLHVFHGGSNPINPLTDCLSLCSGRIPSLNSVKHIPSYNMILTAPVQEDFPHLHFNFGKVLYQHSKELECRISRICNVLLNVMNAEIAVYCRYHLRCIILQHDTACSISHFLKCIL